jgi:hypothetical protein
MADATKDDPVGVPDDSYILRRISPLWYVLDEGTGEYRVSSAAFCDLGDAMSVGLTVVLDEIGRQPIDVVDGFSGYGLLRFNVSWVRADLALGVVRSPTDDEPWHGDVHGRKTDSIRRRFARNGTDWVRRPDPPG